MDLLLQPQGLNQDTTSPAIGQTLSTATGFGGKSTSKSSGGVGTKGVENKKKPLSAATKGTCGSESPLAC
ncbi:hypothetical protein OPV22_023072 [Ensete ventricosum]|uniref:Uncharacterized protein n=1 Tax=Ensete ventricosum TaxID=4639 RepID=A0AAV8PCF1_ENSVE|nr:hypothetical protein OPV22_023072 [Ensete ventricosum]